MEYIKKYWIVIVIAFFLCMFISIAACLLILGSLILYFSLASLKKQAQLSKTGMTAIGKIRSYISDSDGDRTPIIEFITADGTRINKQPFIYTSTDADKFQSYKTLIDTDVKVLYNPLKPEEFVIANEKPWNDLILVLFAIASLIVIGVAIADFGGFIKLRH
jgi:hypothetical protein